MPIKKALFNIKGMTRDLAASKFSPEFAFENRNMRILATDDNTSGVLVNEKGNLRVDNGFNGTVIGQATLNDNLIVFVAGGRTKLEIDKYEIAGLTPSGISSIKQYRTLDDALDDNNAQALTSIQGYDEDSYYTGAAGYCLAYTDGQNRKVFQPKNPTDVPFVSSYEDSTIYYCEGEVLPDVGVNEQALTSFYDIGTAITDSIYKLYFNNGDLQKESLYSGELQFNPEHPIESISVYENEELQKVYWTDGLNQPRVINIAKSLDAETPKDYFDFIRELSLGETVTITRNAASSGIFAPGTIQYILAYHNLYGQQSNVCYSSPLYYISHADRGGNPTDTIGVSFTITVSNPDTKYDYLRVYALHRTSINATPQARKVVDLAVPASGDIVYTDFGTAGETIDPTELLYIGGYPIKAGTLEQKDNTLFLGDITVNRNTASKNSELVSAVRDLSSSMSFGTKTITTAASSGYYSYSSQLSGNSESITTYKRGETYRFGLQFQDTYGVWSDPLLIGDIQVQMTASDYSISDTSQNLIKPTVQISSAIITKAAEAGYKRVRPVVVFPSLGERTVVCQGVLCPTVYNVENRFADSPTVMSSWFFRPNAPTNSNNNPGYSSSPSTAGTWAEYRHNRPIPGNIYENAEIQCISNPPSRPELGNSHNSYTEESNDPAVWVAANREAFYIDRSVVTFHSPDIEFDSEIKSIDSSNLKLRIVGCVPITAHISDIDITTSTPPLNYAHGDVSDSYPETATGFGKYRVFKKHGIGALTDGWKLALSGPYWLDEFYGSINDNSGKKDIQFIVYPWHRHGSLNNTRGVEEGKTASAMLQKKKLSNLRYSNNTYWTSESQLDISGIAMFDSNEDTIVKLSTDETKSGFSEIIYSGNISKSYLFHTAAKTWGDWNQHTWGALDPDTDSDDVDNGSESNSFYPIIAINNNVYTGLHSWATPDSLANLESGFEDADRLKNTNNYYHRIKSVDPAQNPTNPIWKSIVYYSSKTTQSCSNDPVSIKYKSTPHAVIALDYTSDHRQIVAPENFNATTQGLYTGKLFWDPNRDSSTSSKYIIGYQTTYINKPVSLSDDVGYLWMAELYNDNVTNRFGGTTEEALESNNWLPAGEAWSFSSTSTPQNIYWTEGDTYYQRYDCLKTYPYTLEDENSVVEILSFMCETRVNIDGRYDRNRGRINNLYMTPANFNLFNPVYTQKNNFFSYHGVNKNKLVLQGFPNTITWTKTKTLGEEIDTWTNITLASTLDLDGDLGKVRALRRFKDSLLVFQDNGISQVLYNENVQIASTTGVPIEIANSGKVTGKRYISNKIGCTNKWSICSTPNGLYFYDGLSKDIYLFNGEFNNLSDRFGFHSWVVNNLNSTEPWTPVEFEGNITHYDKVNGEVLFVTKNDCLAFSEPSGQFTSFYDYGSTPVFANIKDRGIVIHRAPVNSSYENYPYLHHEGNYNQFFDVYKPYGTTVVVNPNPTEDKVFNNLEFRADTFNSDNECQHNITFDTLTTWNEYQEGTTTLANTPDRPSTLKKKFRVWRANIPRNTTNKGGTETIKYTRDRMRNPWLYLKLSMENGLNRNYKTILHDLVVDYFE